MKFDAEDCENCGCVSSDMEWYPDEEAYHCPNCGEVQ